MKRKLLLILHNFSQGLIWFGFTLTIILLSISFLFGVIALIITFSIILIFFILWRINRFIPRLQNRESVLRKIYIASLVIYILCPNLMLQAAIGHFTRLGKKALSQPPGNFSCYEKTNIYFFGIIMGVGGFLAGYPEVAKEHLLLYLPGKEERSWNSCFALKSAKIQKPVRKFIRKLNILDASIREFHMEPEIVVFHYNQDPYRFALALNPAQITAHAKRNTQQPGKWDINVKCTVKIAYPREAIIRVPLPGIKQSFPVYEGMFWVLQQKHWLFPYQAHWLCELKNHD